MKEHFCPAEQSIITYQGECSWCGESEGSMTQDEIIEMARQAGIEAESDTLCRFGGWVEPFVAFANHVAKHTLMNIDPSKFMSHQEVMEAARMAEREACAKVAERFEPDEKTSYVTYASTAIRARGQA